MPNVSSNRISLFLFGLVMISLAPAADGKGRLTYQTVHGAGLEGNLLGDSPNRQVMVYLPPSYTTAPTRHYPAIYLLHGHNGTNTIWRDGAYQGFNILTAMDRLIEEGKIREMIVVMPDGRNAYGGTYFVNSSVTGNWRTSSPRTWCPISTQRIARSRFPAAVVSPASPWEVMPPSTSQ